MQDTIAERIDDLAREYLAELLDPDYVSDMHELLGSQIHHLIFGGKDADEGGRVWPRNEDEWRTLRAMPRFAQLLKDHSEDRLDAGYYANPVTGLSVALTASIADIVAYRAIELNRGVNTVLRSRGKVAEKAEKEQLYLVTDTIQFHVYASNPDEAATKVLYEQHPFATTLDRVVDGPFSD